MHCKDIEQECIGNAPTRLEEPLDYRCFFYPKKCVVPEYTIFFLGYHVSHPDNLDDPEAECLGWKIFPTKDQALDFFQNHALKYASKDVQWVEADMSEKDLGGIPRFQKNPSFDVNEHRNKQLAQKRVEAYEQRERAMQAGMAFGCEAYNDEMGY